MSNLNSQIIALINAEISLAAQIQALQQQAAALNTQFTQLTAATPINAMSTCALAADGTLGTADVSPSAAAGHVIDTRVYAALSRAVNSADMASVNTFLAAFVTFSTGGAASQQGQAPGLLAKLTGG